MSTQILQPIQIISGGYKTVATEAASQSFKIGQPVYLVAGLVTACASDGVVIYGIALQDATGTPGSKIDVQVDDGTLVLRGNVYHSTAESAVTAVANRGVKYALYVSGNLAHVDIGDTDNDAIVIISLDQSEVGDTYGRCNFKFITAVLQSDAAAT